MTPTATAATYHQPPSTASNRRIGTPTTALRKRRRSTSRCPQAARAHHRASRAPSVGVSEPSPHGGQASEAPVAATEFANGPLKVCLAEVGPVQRRRPVFGVRGLPDQEVAQAHL